MTLFTIAYCKSLHVDALSFYVSKASSFGSLGLNFFISFAAFSSYFPASHPLCWPFAGILLKLETLFFSLCGCSDLRYCWFYSGASHYEVDRKKGKKMREKRKRNSLDTQHLHHACGSKLSVWLLACLSGRFLSLCKCVFVNKSVYNIISNIIRVYRPNMTVLVSVMTMTKLDCWLPTMAVQR